MTQGTSPQGGSPSNPWADAVAHFARAARLWLAGATDMEINWPWLARGAAALHLCGLALLLTMAWHDPLTAGAGAAMGGLPALHLAFLMATGAAAALLALGASGARTAAIANEDRQAGAGVNHLLAQMSHELRTPLNAMIGFSEVMLRELHGPLGHARYQEYAAHITESGGRLLKSSEDTLAVTATMSALMADRRAVRRERVLAATLVREAWAAAAAGAANREVRLTVANCSSCEIECERRATGQALEHLLREAIAQTPTGGTVEVKGRRRGGARSIEIRARELDPSQGQVGVSPLAPDVEFFRDGRGEGSDPLVSGGSLRVILARLLLEMQSATLSLWDHDAGSWSACVAFPTRSGR